MPKTDYDEFAEVYSAANEVSLFNAHYERPAMLNLAGDVDGRRILDAGCGSGPLSAALRDRGAVVSGFDRSAAMIELARRRLGESADLMVHDLAERLPYADATFEDVVASLVLHYLMDWSGPLSELRRVLKPGGRLLVSVNHPMVYPFSSPEDFDYFGVVEYSYDVEYDGREVIFTHWHRPLQAMSEAFTAAGFRIAVISEPPVDRGTPADLLPKHPTTGEPVYQFVSFIFFVLEAC